MAKTYAGYVKREVANEIDWSSIGSGIRWSKQYSGSSSYARQAIEKR